MQIPVTLNDLECRKARYTQPYNTAVLYGRIIGPCNTVATQATFCTGVATGFYVVPGVSC